MAEKCSAIRERGILTSHSRYLMHSQRQTRVQKRPPGEDDEESDDEWDGMNESSDEEENEEEEDFLDNVDNKE